MENHDKKLCPPNIKSTTLKQLQNGTLKSKKTSRHKKNLIRYVRFYTDTTGIHGLRYTVEKGRSTLERVLWVVIFCTSLYGCIVLIRDTWKKWDKSPVLVSFAKTPTYVWDIPFPAVTICPQTKARKQEFDFTDAYNKWRDGRLEDEGAKNFSASALICDSNLYTEGNMTIGLDAIDHIRTVAPQLRDTFLNCVWNLHRVNCSQVFTEILTEDGLCFTFNMLSVRELFTNDTYLDNSIEEVDDKSEWSLENGYPKTAKSDAYPRRVMSSGFTGSLVVLLDDYTQDIDYLCRDQPQGFKIMLHNPEEMPRASMRYYQAPSNEELLISVMPDMMKTSENLKDYPPHKRECFFRHEKHLSFFQRYTQQNCEIECQANFTLSKCGCVALHMPRKNSTPVCGPKSSQCLSHAATQLLEQEVEYGISGFNFYGKQFSTSGCNCLPACNSLIYNAEFSQTDFNWRQVLLGFRENLTETNPGIQLTRLTIFFKQPQFIISERNELFGTADFLANCGGILGLFTGFSLISLVEIIYFVSVRFLCNMKTYGKQYWAGAPKTE